MVTLFLQFNFTDHAYSTMLECGHTFILFELQ